jgi:class 3 adenylate cyclase/pimeloyl-ACP methyl ester carboxylesterase
MCEGLGVRRGDVAYAKAGDHHIAFREYLGGGGGDHEIVMVNGANFPMDSLLDDPVASRLLEGLAGLGRLLVFDRRGIALSDPVTDWETPLWEQWAEDLAAVVEASGCDGPTVFSWCSHPVARACSVRHPRLLGRLVLMNPRASLTDTDAELRNVMAQGFARMRSGEAGPGADIANPGRRGDPAYRSWNDAAGRAGASPSLAARMMDKQLSDPPFDNGEVPLPTLIISRRPGVIPGVEVLYRRAVQEIANAEHVDLGVGDFFPVGAGVDDILALISRYATGDVRLPAPERQLAVIVFTDLEGSTRRAISAGDQAWKRLLDHHDDVSRYEVTRRGGDVVKNTGDGILALMPSATGAIDAARAIRTELGNDSLRVRTGVHIGEVDRRGDDVSGAAVNKAARIVSTAVPGQIAVSEVVTHMTDGVAYRTLGLRVLKDFDDTCELFEVL